jgi:hypothetical protein
LIRLEVRTAAIGGAGALPQEVQDQSHPVRSKQGLREGKKTGLETRIGALPLPSCPHRALPRAWLTELYQIQARL